MTYRQIAMQSIRSFFENMQCDISLHALNELLLSSPYHCFFIKDQKSNYQYANDNFIQLMGLKTLKQLRALSDLDMSQSKRDAKKYRELDCEVLDSKDSVKVSEIITPELNQPLIKEMSGVLYPVFFEKEQTAFVLGLVSPKSKLITLDWESLFRLTHSDIKALLVKRSYDIQLSFGFIRLSKMELLTLIELVKGRHAGEMATELSLKQSTVESYLTTIKNKCGVTSKGELINLLITQGVFKQIVV